MLSLKSHRREIREERQPALAGRDGGAEEDAQVLLLPDDRCTYSGALPGRWPGHIFQRRHHQNGVTTAGWLVLQCYLLRF